MDNPLSDADIAVTCFMDGFNCAQSLLSTFGPRLGLERETALRVAGAFGGGMARTGLVCGAVSGALMVIGVKYAMTHAGERERREETYRRSQEFIRRFKELNGSVLCPELLGFDLSTPEGLKTVGERELFATVCPKLVRDAAAIVAALLIDPA